MNRITKRTLCGRALLSTVVSLLVCSPDALFAEEPFYKDKRITILVSGTGSYEGYARLVAKHMGKHIPGNPTFIVKGMIGASGLKLANYIYSAAPKDGTEIAAVHGHIPTAPVYMTEGIEYDPTKLGWIGSVTKETFIAYAWHTSPVTTMQAAKTTESIVGGQTVGAMSVDMAIIANAFMGTKFKIVTGYEGSAGARLAVEKGEVHGVFGSAWNSIRSDKPDWIRDRKIVVFSQFGQNKHKDLADVPLLLPEIKDATDRAAVELYLARSETGKPYFAPPGLPAERLATLQQAFDEMVKDPAFMADVEKARYELSEPLGGPEVDRFVKRMAATPKSTVNRLNQVFAYYTAGK